MSLLALLADKFELEQPPPPSAAVDGVDGDGARHDGDDDAHRRHRHVVSSTAVASDIEGDGDAGDDTVLSSPLEATSKDGAANDDARHPEEEGCEECDVPGGGASGGAKDETKLLVTFLLMVVVGTVNKVFQKLQAIPMYNYPNSLNLLQK